MLSLAVDPVAPDAVYAGTAGLGIYKSDHWGDAWLPRGPTGTKVSSVLLQPLVPGFFYGATEQGVFRTTDDGGFWIGVGLHEHDLSALAIDRPLPTRIFASGFAAGVFQSDDGGNSWAVNSLGLGDRAVKSLAAGGAVVFAGTQAGGAFRQASVALPTTTTTIRTTTSTTSTSSTTATGAPSTTTSSTVASTTTTTSTLASTTTVSTSTSTTNPSTTMPPTTATSIASTTSTTQTPTTLAPGGSTTTSTTLADECGRAANVLSCLLTQAPEAPECVGETLPPALLRSLRQALRAADQAGRSTTPARTRRALRQAAQRTKRAGALALKLGSRQKLSVPCAEALWARLTPVAERAAARP